jgi:hypothetical protein
MFWDFLRAFMLQPIVALIGFIFCWFSIFFIAMFKDDKSKN